MHSIGYAENKEPLLLWERFSFWGREDRKFRNILKDRKVLKVRKDLKVRKVRKDRKDRKNRKT